MTHSEERVTWVVVNQRLTELKVAVVERRLPRSLYVSFTLGDQTMTLDPDELPMLFGVLAEVQRAIGRAEQIHDQAKVEQAQAGDVGDEPGDRAAVHRDG